MNSACLKIALFHVLAALWTVGFVAASIIWFNDATEAHVAPVDGAGAVTYVTIDEAPPWFAGLVAAVWAIGLLTLWALLSVLRRTIDRSSEV